jgi:alanyl-tRNA synthetase
MTEKLYYTKPDLVEWETKVKSIKKEKGQVIIELEETAFYPEGGGQPSDKGWVDDLEVLDVYEEKGKIYHLLSGEIIEDKVRCRVDYSRRMDHMQQHSGQHLLSAVFMEFFEGETKGFHLGQEYCSIDIGLQNLTPEKLNMVENISNEYIYCDLEVKTYIVTKEEIHSLPLRKFPKVTEDIRIVEIDQFDYSPCCGTHVQSTGQLGVIKINKTENYKGMTRIYFKCGRRALDDYRAKEMIVSSLVSQMSTPENELIERITQEQLRFKNLAEEMEALKEQLLKIEAEKYLKSSNTSFLVLRLDKLFPDVQKLGRILLESGVQAFLISSLKDNKLFFGHNGSLKINCGQLIKEGLAVVPGKGGGGPTQAQAAFESDREMKKLEEFLAKKVTGCK